MSIAALGGLSKELETQKNLHALNTTVKNTMDAIVKNFENDFFTPEAYQKFESLSSTLASKRGDIQAWQKEKGILSSKTFNTTKDEKKQKLLEGEIKKITKDIQDLEGKLKKLNLKDKKSLSDDERQDIVDTEQKIKDSKHEKQIKEQEIQRIKDNIQKTKDKEQENKDKKDQNSLQYTMNSQYINSTISNALATTNTILTIADSIDYQNPLIISLTDKEKKNHINLDNYFKKSSSVTIDYDTISVPPFSVEVHGITYHNATIDPGCYKVNGDVLEFDDIKILDSTGNTINPTQSTSIPDIPLIVTGKKDGKQLKFKNTIKVSLHPAGITKEQKEFEENIEAQRDFSATITAGGSETISTWEYFYKKSISDLKAINGGVDPILDLKNPSGGFPLKIRRTINGINENIEVDGSFDVNTGEFKITTIKHEDVSGVMVPFVLESNLDIDCDMGATIKDANGKDHKPTKKLRMTILPAGMKPGQKEFEENINSDPAMEKNIYTDTPQTVETRPMFYKKDQSELPTGYSIDTFEIKPPIAGGEIQIPGGLVVGGIRYDKVYITGCVLDPVTGVFTFNKREYETAVGVRKTLSLPEDHTPIPADVTINAIAKRTGLSDQRLSKKLSLQLQPKTLSKEEHEKKENILRDPAEFSLSTRLGQENRIDQYFYKKRSLPAGTNFDVLDTYNGAALTPPSHTPGNNRSVIRNTTVDGVTYEEIRVKTSLVTRSNGSKILTITHVEYVGSDGQSHPLEKGVLENIQLPVEADFNGEKVEKTINLTVNIEQARPLPADFNDYVGVDLHQDLPKPTVDTAFEYEGFGYNYTPADGWTIKDKDGNVIYHKGKFDLGRYTSWITNNTDYIFGYKTGFKEEDTKRERGLKRGGNITKWLIMGPTGILGYHGFKKISKWSTNIGVNKFKLRDRTVKHIRGRIGQVALTGVYKGYFQTEVEQLNPENPVYTEHGGYRYTLHENNITITPAGAVVPEIAQETIISEAGQKLIRGDKDQKLGVGYALTIAMRGDTSNDRSLGEILGDTGHSIAETLRLATPLTESAPVTPLHGRPSREQST